MRQRHDDDEETLARFEQRVKQQERARERPTFDEQAARRDTYVSVWEQRDQTGEPP
jgi:hypothetical protein